MDEEHEAFVNWLAGFIDGEGSFGLTEQNGQFSPRFVLNLRFDDWATLAEIQKTLGYGRLQMSQLSVPGKNASIRWVISRLDDAILFKRLLSGKLRARKRQQYEYWAEAVTLAQEYGGGRHSLARERLGELHVAIRDFNKFVDTQEVAEVINQQVVLSQQGFAGRTPNAEARAANGQARRTWWTGPKGTVERERRRLAAERRNI